MQSRKFIPKHFQCPECGEKSISISDMDKTEATVRCSSCGIEKKVSKKRIYQPVDVFGDFVDLYNQEKGVDIEYKPDVKETANTTTLKKEKTVEEVFGDKKGFLEF